MERRGFLVGAAAGGAMLATAAQAQAYPNRIITIVVPFGAGSGTDVTGRIVAHNLGPALGQNVIIENKVGATGMIAASAVAQSPADGYTLMFATNSTHGSNPSLFKKITYDPVRDFAPIGRLGAFGYFVVVNAQLPVRSIEELVAYAKANPDKLSYGSGSSTSYIMAETFKRGTGAPIMRVPYRSNPAALTDLVAGRITVMFADISSSVAFVKSNDLRALAVTSLSRSAIVPELPTLNETVMPGFDIESWTGLLAPAGTPQPTVDRLNLELNRILATPDIRQRLLELGVEPQPTSPAEFGRFVQTEVRKWDRLVTEAGIEAA